MDRDWLAGVSEQAIEPELEIVDAHHHLWDRETAYGLYDLADLRADTDPPDGSGHRVGETVFIDCGSNYLGHGPEAMRPVGESRWVAGRADEADRSPGARINAIVSHADLTLGQAVTEVLQAHIEAAGGRFRGIRHSGARLDDAAVPTSRVQPPAGLYGQADFRAGAAALAALGLSFEAWQYHPQLDDVVQLARALPQLPIVINHIGGPVGVGGYAGRRDEVLAELRRGLAPLARCDNVYIKLGGIGMTRFGTDWLPEGRPPNSDEVAATWGGILRWCIDTFGPTRSMFESNYPVDGETTGYNVLWNAFKKVSADYSPSERSELLAGTARRFYRL